MIRTSQTLGRVGGGGFFNKFVAGTGASPKQRYSLSNYGKPTSVPSLQRAFKPRGKFQ